MEFIFLRGLIFLRLWLVFLFLLWGFLKDLLELMLFKLFVFLLCFRGNGFSIIFRICLWFFFLFFEFDGEVFGDLLWFFFIFFEFNVVIWGFVFVVFEFEWGEDGGCGINFMFWVFFFLVNSGVFFLFLIVLFDDELSRFLFDCDCFCWRSLGWLKDCCMVVVWRLWLKNE